MSREGKNIRVLLTKSHLDAHDRGIRYVAGKLMEAGFEVIFTRYGLPEEVVNTALEEDVDAIGISFSTAGHQVTIPELLRLLRERNMENVLVLVGGIIPHDEVPELLSMGVRAVFGPGASTDDVVQLISEHVASTVWQRKSTA